MDAREAVGCAIMAAGLVLLHLAIGISLPAVAAPHRLSLRLVSSKTFLPMRSKISPRAWIAVKSVEIITQKRENLQSANIGQYCVK